tara:strand:- start:529 stop:1830 length:1302 start_codon:yes stop_codon:yes gene_type:complete
MNNSSPRFKVLDSNNKAMKKENSEDTSLHLGLISNPAKVKNNLLNLKINEDSETSTESSDSSSSSDETTSKKTSTTTNTTAKPNTVKIPSFNLNGLNLNSGLPKPNNTPFTRPNVGTQNTFKPQNTFVKPPNPSFKPPPIAEVKKELSPQEKRMKKIELLRKLSEIKSKGYELSKDYSFNSSIEEMEYEYELLKSFASKRQGIKLYKNILLNSVSAMEFLNDKYDPFSFQLDGWSEHVSVEIDSWEDILEEIYEKYKGAGQKMAPEVKLLLLVTSSAAAFHHSKSTFKNIPGLDKIIENNPGLLSKVTTGLMGGKKEDSQFMTRQEIHLNKQREIQRQRDSELRKAQMNRMKNNNQPSVPIPNRRVTEIKAPQNVQNIIAQMKKEEDSSDSSTEDSSSNHRIVSHNRVQSDSLTSSTRRRGRKKNAIMKINTN